MSSLASMMKGRAKVRVTIPLNLRRIESSVPNHHESPRNKVRNDVREIRAFEISVQVLVLLRILLSQFHRPLGEQDRRIRLGQIRNDKDPTKSAEDHLNPENPSPGQVRIGQITTCPSSQGQGGSYERGGKTYRR